MQTATDFIKEKLDKLGLLDKGQVMTNIFEKAKQMEKEQIEDAFQDGKWDWAEHITKRTDSKDLAQYYQEKYGGEK